MEVLTQRFNDHIQQDNERFASLTKDIMEINENLATIKDNHIQHLQTDISSIKVEVSDVKADVRWIKMIGGAILLETLGVLGTLVSILIKK